VIRKRFAYHRPADVTEVIEVLAAEGRDACVLAGGTLVVPELTIGSVQPTAVVDLRSAGLDTIRADGDHLRIGATTTYADLAASEAVAQRAPVLQSLARGITGGPQIRNQGTIGGSACYASPSSDVPAALVALDARLRLVSVRGEREVPAKEFFTGACATLRADDELLSEIAVAYGSAQVRFGYYKLKLCESSWPIATAACAVTVRADGVCTAARLALGGVAAIPVVVPVEDILVGTTIGETELTAVAARAEAAVVTPWSDVLADGTYRRGVAGVVAKRALSRTTLPTPP